MTEEFSDRSLRRLAEQAQKLSIDNPQLTNLIHEALESIPSSRGFDAEYLLLLLDEDDLDFDAIRDEINKLRSTIRRSTFGQQLFSDYTFKETEWLLENWIPHKDISMLTSLPGIGKSFLSLQIAMAAVGEIPQVLVPDGNEKKFGMHPPFFFPEEYSIEKGVFIHWEDTFDTVSRRRFSVHQEFAELEGQDSQEFIIPEERMDASADLLTLYMPELGAQNAIWAPPTRSHVDTIGELTDSGKRLRDRVTEHQADFLIIDTVTHAFSGNINERAAVSPFLGYLQTWAREDEVSILLIDHPPKSGEAFYSGSVAWMGIVRSLMTIVKEETHAGEIVKMPCPEHPRGRKNCDECYEEVIDEGSTEYYIKQVKSSYGPEQNPVAARRLPKSGAWANQIEGVL